MVAKQVVFILVLAAIIGLGLNLFSPNRIPYIGQYRSLASGNDPIITPDAEKGDPPFIGLAEAQLEFSSGRSVFIDTREPEEFECGTIPGAINIPFDYLPDDGLETYIDSALSGMKLDHPLITFCSGDECDLSLHLARNMQALGYTSLSIFFGGSREWEKSGLQMERRAACDE